MKMIITMSKDVAFKMIKPILNPQGSKSQNKSIHKE